MARKKTKPATKPKGKPEPLDDEDDAPARGRYDEDDDAPAKPKKPGSDVYVGLSAIGLVALAAAATFFYLDSDASGKKTLSAPQVEPGELKTR